MSLPRVPGCGGPPAPRLRPSDSVERPGSLYARPIPDGARVPADRKGGAPEAICKGLPATTSTPAIRPAPHTARPHPSPSRTLHPSPVLGPASGPDTATGSSWGFPGVLAFCGAWKCAQHWDCGPWERHLLLGYQGPPSECVPSSPTPTGTPVAVGGGSHPPACSPSFQPHPAHSGLCKHPPPPPPLPLDPGGGRRGGGGVRVGRPATALLSLSPSRSCLTAQISCHEWNVTSGCQSPALTINHLGDKCPGPAGQ